MKFTILILATFISLSFAVLPDQHVCRILLDKYDRAAMYSRNFLVGSSTRWPDAVVPYKISSGFTSTEVAEIKKAMRLIEGSTCVKFVEYKNQPNYINIFTGGSGCYASLGFNPHRKVGELHLQTNSYCMDIGAIAHEMMHVLGFDHEHTRPDRDQYLKINWTKLSSDDVDNWFRAGGENEDPLPSVCNAKDPHKKFDTCYSGYKASTFGLAYDYGSVMHYDLHAGSTDGSKVMTAKNPIPPGITVGQRIGPTVLDFRKINRAYPCNKEVTPKPACFDKYSICKHLAGLCNFFSDDCRKTCGTCP